MSVLARCTHCDFSRRFADELAGRFYRCPRCREGVIAVPQPLFSTSEEMGALGLSSSSFELPLSLRKPPRPQEQETEENSALDRDAIDDVLAERRARGRPAPQDPAEKTEVDHDRPAKLGGPPAKNAAPAGAASRPAPVAEEKGPHHKGEVATARRLLVECALCGFNVRIPVEFFGKTVHCPECAGNTVFTESTLEPVKDELLDRLALETQERELLFPPGEERAPRPWARLWNALGRNNALRSFLVGVGLGLLVLLSLWVAHRLRAAGLREAAVEAAEVEGWRYGANPGSDVFHEPWCMDLDPVAGPRLTREQLEALTPAATLHECR